MLRDWKRHRIFVRHPGPAAIAFAALAWVPRLGIKCALTSAAWLLGLTAGLLALLPTFLKLWPGIMSTTVIRSYSGGILSVVEQAWTFEGFVLVLAAVGVAMCCSGERDIWRALLLFTCFGAALLVPVEQARIQLGFSQEKHVAVGIWMAAIAAGYALDRVAGRLTFRSVAASATVGAVAFVFPFVNGVVSASEQHSFWPNSTALVREIGKLVPHAGGQFLVQQAQIPEYYLHQSDWRRWQGVTSLKPGKNGFALQSQDYVREVADRQFHIVALNFSAGAQGSVAFTHEILQGTNGPTVRRTLLHVISNSSSAPALNAAVTKLLSDPAYQVTAIIPYSSPYAQGSCVMWTLKASVR